jgi:menaquinone-dependent protoporphyrinogen oxidase
VLGCSDDAADLGRSDHAGLTGVRRHPPLAVNTIADVGLYEAVVLGSAVYMGLWLKEATDFARRHREQLTARPLWLFSSGPLGTDVVDDEEQPKELAELREMLEPRDHRLLYGALNRDALGFCERRVVKAVKAPEGDFRDWDEIRAWAAVIAASSLGTPRPKEEVAVPDQVPASISRSTIWRMPP